MLTEEQLETRLINTLTKLIPDACTPALPPPHALLAREQAYLFGTLMWTQFPNQSASDNCCLLALNTGAAEPVVVYVRLDLVGRQVFSALVRSHQAYRMGQLEVRVWGCAGPRGTVEATWLAFADLESLREGHAFTICGSLVQLPLYRGCWIRDARGQYNEVWLPEELPDLLAHTRDIVCSGEVRRVDGQLRRCADYMQLFRTDQKLKELK